MGQGPGMRLEARGRERPWWLLALALAGAVPAVVLAGVSGAPPWLQVVAAAVGVLAGVVAEELRTRRSRDRALAAAVRACVAGARERLPAVADVTPAGAGVQPAMEEVGYVERDVEARLAEALREGGRVLVMGAAMAGKTRVALQVAQQGFGGHLLLKPKDGTALHRLLALGVTPDRLVVWLDDLERFLGADGLTADDLEAFCRNGTVAVATIRTSAYKELLPKRNLKPPGGDVLNWFGAPEPLRDWKPDELERAAGKASARVLEGARRYGLSSYVGGGPAALREFQAGEDECPAGHALVRAAVDWRRVGMSSAVPHDTLVSLAPAYLRAAPGSPEAGPAAMAEGLGWATTRLNQTVALLEETPAGYEVLDYLVDHVAADHPEVPERLWDTVTELASPGELVNVGYLAATRHGRQDRAEAIWSRSRNAIALYNLGQLHYRPGDERAVREAERWWRLAAEAGDPGAMFSLSVLLRRRGDPESVREAERWSGEAARATSGRVPSRPAAPVADGEPDIGFSGAAGQEHRRTLTAALRAYMEYLEGLQVPVRTALTVHVEPKAMLAYPDPARGRLFVGEPLAGDPSTVLHEFSHWVLEELVDASRDAWTDDMAAVEAGLAYYLPCSVADNPRTAFVSLTSAAQVPGFLADYLDPAHLNGLRWAGSLWELRDSLGREALDEPLLAAWTGSDPARQDRTGFVDRLCELLARRSGRSAREVVGAALARHGIIER